MLRSIPAIDDPMEVLRRWLDDARERGEPLPEAMTLATVSADGEPSARSVICKEIDGRGLLFDTPLYSRKAAELRGDPRVALHFHWKSTNRQVRISGTAEVLDRATAERHFAARPRGHQLQAHVSRQGEEIEGLEPLRAALADAARRFGDGPIPCPDDWGAVRVVPEVVEFWEQGDDRLHERLELRRGDDGRWTARKLAP